MIPLNGERESGPNTLSLRSTCWLGRPFANDSIFLPSLAKMRPLKDISRSLSGGPTDWEANAEFSSRRFPFNRVFCSTRFEIRTRAKGSRSPMGFTPLNSFRARPSQKLRKLNTALIIVGVFRGSTSRAGGKALLKIEASGLPLSVGLQGKGSIRQLMSTKCWRKTPCEEATSLVSNKRDEDLVAGSLSLKSAH